MPRGGLGACLLHGGSSTPSLVLTAAFPQESPDTTNDTLSAPPGLGTLWNLREGLAHACLLEQEGRLQLPQPWSQSQVPTYHGLPPLLSSRCFSQVLTRTSSLLAATHAVPPAWITSRHSLRPRSSCLMISFCREIWCCDASTRPGHPHPRAHLAQHWRLPGGQWVP